MSLNSKMMTSMLSRLTEHVADTNEEVQSYVMEIMLTMEAAVGHTPDSHREYTYEGGSELVWKHLSSLGELTSKPRSGSLKDDKTDEERESVSGSPYKRVHERVSYVSPERVMSSPDKKSSSRYSAESDSYRRSLLMTTAVEGQSVQEITLVEESLPPKSGSTGDVPSIVERASIDNRDIEADDVQSSKEGRYVARSNQEATNKDFVPTESMQKAQSLSRDRLSPCSDSENTPTAHPTHLHRRKHSRNQSMSKPMDFEGQTSLPNDDVSMNSETSTLTSSETAATSQSLPVGQISQVASPLSHSVVVALNKVGTSSQTSSPAESPSRSPVRSKKQLKSGNSSTSKLLDSNEATQSLYPPHQPLKRKGSEPARPRVHELKSAFSRVKRYTHSCCTYACSCICA